VRLDLTLVERGLVATRSRARDLIRRGAVTVDGEIVLKPALEIGAENVVGVAAGAALVSRGGEKLMAGLDRFGFDAAGASCLDVGASTGGFTEVLLARGARKVFAVDVGHGQLAPSLRDDPRVVVLEGTDARSLSPELIPDPIDGLVADLSFISIAKALGPALALVRPGGWAIVLVKPQFEVGPGGVGKGGLVRDETLRRTALEAAASWLASVPGWRVAGHMASPLTGGSGNIEYLLGALRDG
jgi:23S rRNA (cytidine1920-2'-O)/16S rRNA (cytidine1409-2'-O)-methyltransferase